MSFWKPGEDRPEHLAHPTSERNSLPIFVHRKKLLNSIEHHGVVIVVAETGSGKSTEIPIMLHTSGWTSSGFQVLCTQPRPLAVQTLAKHVSDLLNVRLGEEVGYCIPFDTQASDTNTRIKYCTDDILLRELVDDPVLTQYSVVIIDEAHERSASTDTAMGLLRLARIRRPELRIIISSATIDAEFFRDFFSIDPNEVALERLRGERAKALQISRDEVELNESEIDIHQLLHSAIQAIPEPLVNISTAETAPKPRKSRWADAPQPLDPVPQESPEIIARRNFETLNEVVIEFVKGSVHPVEIQHLKEPCEDVLSVAALTAIQIHEKEGPGDILVFLARPDDVYACEKELSDLIFRRKQAYSYSNAHSHSGTQSEPIRFHEGESNNNNNSYMAELEILLLHQRLSLERQSLVFTPNRVDHSGRPIRRVILSTNVAESAITIPNIRFVVDSGLAEKISYHPYLNASAFVTAACSGSSLRQRAGRAGRTSPGKCFRLFPKSIDEKLNSSDISPISSTESDINSIEEPRIASYSTEIPEIQLCDFAPFLFILLSVGVGDPAHFPLPSYPSEAAMVLALDELDAMGLISVQNLENHSNQPKKGLIRLSTEGRAASMLPCGPAHAVALLRGARTGVADLVLGAVVLRLISPTFPFAPPTAPMNLKARQNNNNTTGHVQELDVLQERLATRQGDHLSGLNALLAWEAAGHTRQWLAENGFSRFHPQFEMCLKVKSALRRSLRKAVGYLNLESSTNLKTAPANITEKLHYSIDGDPSLSSEQQQERVLKALLAGFPLNIAKLEPNGRYKTLRDGAEAMLHPHSYLRRFEGPQPPRWLLFERAEVSSYLAYIESQAHGVPPETFASTLFLSGVSVISQLWLLECAPSVYAPSKRAVAKEPALAAVVRDAKVGLSGQERAELQERKKAIQSAYAGSNGSDGLADDYSHLNPLAVDDGQQVLLGPQWSKFNKESGPKPTIPKGLAAKRVMPTHYKDDEDDDLGPNLTRTSNRGKR